MPPPATPAKTLLEALNERDATTAKSLLLKGAQVGDPGLLIAASLWGSQPIIAALLKAGANPNAADDKGNTPLHHAAQAGLPFVVNYLLQNGADPCLENTQGQTAADEKVAKTAAIQQNIIQTQKEALYANLVYQTAQKFLISLPKPLWRIAREYLGPKSTDPEAVVSAATKTAYASMFKPRKPDAISDAVDADNSPTLGIK